MFRILVVEDDIRFQQLLKTVLSKNGYNVGCCDNAEDGLELFHQTVFDLVISDVMMPNIDGFEFVSSLREINKQLPILFVTALDSFVDKQRGFELGIDDYMVKPVDLNELVLRVKALLRRSQIVTEHQLIVGLTTLDYDNLTVSRNNSKLELPQKEFYILYKLLSNPDKIFTRAQLMDEFWGAYTDSIDRTIDVHITRLRDKFKENPDFEILTIRGLGYKAVYGDEKTK
jgi:two-component system, OmpR family, response regulator